MRTYWLAATRRPNVSVEPCKTLFFLLAGYFFLAGTPLIAQRISEKEVGLQEKFIDASREYLLGNYQKAIPIYEDILRDMPTNDAAAYELSRIFDRLNDGEKALRYIRQAIDAAPDNGWYRRFLADLYQKQNKNREAAGVFEELAKREPDNEEYYYRWAYFLVKANDINAALKVYDVFEKRIGINEEIIRRKHSLYVGIGNNKKAAAELERLMAAYPGSLEYRHLLAGFYEQIGESELARTVYKDILTIDPDDPKAIMALAGKSGRPTDDINFLRSLQPIFARAEIEIDPKIVRIMPLINKVAETGDPALAAELLELTQLLETVHPQEAKPYAASADVLYYSGNPAKALEKYQRTLELDETVFLVWEQVLRICLENRDYKSVVRYADQALDLFPNKAFLHYMYGLGSARLQQEKKAIGAFEQAIIMAGDDGRLLFEVQLQKGIVHNNLKQYPAANAAFEAALALNGKAHTALNAYSYALATRGEDLDRARAMAKQANDLAPNRADYQMTYGWVLYKMKDYAGAKSWLSNALANGGDDDPLLLEHYGDVLFQTNDVDGALQYWNKAQEKGSTSEWLEKKITERRLYE